MDKKSFRSGMRQIRAALSDRDILSRRACAVLLASDLWRKAKRPALYASMPEELDTSELLEAAWREGKEPLLPTITDIALKKMEFFAIRSWEEQTPGPMGIREPPATIPIEPDLLILPALAFDKRGSRLGYGGGFYDRWLANHQSLPLMGLCFAVQIVERLPVDPWDFSVNFICSEQGLKCPQDY